MDFSPFLYFVKERQFSYLCCTVTSRELTFGTWMMDGRGMWVQSAIASWFSSLAANTDGSVVADSGWIAVWLPELLFVRPCFSEYHIALNIPSMPLSSACLRLLAARAAGCWHTARVSSVFCSSIARGLVLGWSNGVFSCAFPKQVSRAEQGKGCILDDRLSDPLSLLFTAA